MKKSDGLSKATILLGYSGYTILALAELAGFVILKMTGNPYFLNPVPAIADIQKLLDTYNAACTAAKTRDSDAIKTRGAARDKLIEQLQLLGRWVMGATTDPLQVASSGFPMSKRGQPTPPLPAATNFAIGDGPVPYSIMASVDGSPLVKVYMFQVTDAPPTQDTVWINEPSTVREFVFTNLVAEKRYWFRVILVGSRKQKQYSDVLTRMVQ